MRTHYDNLKVAENAPIEVIRAAYRALCQKMHPDKNPGNADAHRIMQILNDAYTVLSDPASRAAYDDRLRAARQREQRTSPGQNTASTSYPGSAFPHQSAAPPPVRPYPPPPGYQPRPSWRTSAAAAAAASRRRPARTAGWSQNLPFILRPQSVLIIAIFMGLPWIIETCSTPQAPPTIRRAIPIDQAPAHPWLESAPPPFPPPGFRQQPGPGSQTQITPLPRGPMPEVAR